MSTTQFQPVEPGTDRLSARAWAVLLVLCGAIFLEGIDVSMLGVALPSIRADLGMSTGSLQWIVSAYVLGYGGFVLLGGRAADLLGRRRMFLFWLAVFVVFSGLGGLAQEGWVLIIARFIKGVAAGFLTPAGMSIITTSFAEGEARNRALLVYAGLASAGFLMGLVVGGLLTAIDWRWVFFAPVILASLLLVAAVRIIPTAPRPENIGKGFDAAGAICLTAGMLAFVFTLVEAPDAAIGRTILTAAGSLALLGAFVAIERRSRSPLLRLGILRSAALVRANVGAMLFVGAFVAFQFVVVLYLQELRGWSALETGLALVVVSIDMILAPTVAPKLIARFGNVPVTFGGMLLAVAGYALFLPLAADWTYAAMLPTMILLGLAFSLAYGALTIAATDGVAEEEQGLASALLNVSFQFGGALGLAVATAVNVAATGSDGSPQALLDGYRAALIVPVAALIVAIAVTAPGLRRRKSAQPASALSEA